MKQFNDPKLLLDPEPIPEPSPSGNQKAGVALPLSGVWLNNHLKIKLNFASPFINSGQLLKYQVLGGGQWLSLVWALLVVQEVLAPGTVTHTGPSQVLGLMQESGSLWVFLARPALYSQSCVCVCVHCRPPSYVLGSRIPGESCHGVSHLGSSLDPPASTRGTQMPRDGARMGGGSAGHQSDCKLAWHGRAGPSTASETLTAGMSKGSSSRIKAGFRLRLSDRIHLLLLLCCINGNGSHV